MTKDRKFSRLIVLRLVALIVAAALTPLLALSVVLPAIASVWLFMDETDRRCRRWVLLHRGTG